MHSPITHPEQNELVVLAQAATQNAYAPYSNFRVGAAVLLDDGRTFSGCNIENVSFGLSCCAERTAIFRAVAETPGGAIHIRAIAVVNAASEHCSPCGACRQVIAEFASAGTDVIYRGADGMVSIKMGDLLPDSFRM